MQVAKRHLARVVSRDNDLSPGVVCFNTTVPGRWPDLAPARRSALINPAPQTMEGGTFWQHDGPETGTGTLMNKRVLRVASALNVLIYRLSRGKWLGRFPPGAPVCLLTTKGRKSGRSRTVPLLYLAASSSHRKVVGRNTQVGTSTSMPIPLASSRPALDASL